MSAVIIGNSSGLGCFFKDAILLVVGAAGRCLGNPHQLHLLYIVMTPKPIDSKTVDMIRGVSSITTSIMLYGL